MTVEGVLSFRKRDMAVGIGHMLSLPVRKAVGDRRDTGIGVVAQPSESQSGDRLKVSGIKDREIDIVVVTAPHDNSRRQIAVDTHLNIVAGCAMAGGQDVGVPDVDTLSRALPSPTWVFRCTSPAPTVGWCRQDLRSYSRPPPPISDIRLRHRRLQVRR